MQGLLDKSITKCSERSIIRTYCVQGCFKEAVILYIWELVNLSTGLFLTVAPALNFNTCGFALSETLRLQSVCDTCLSHPRTGFWGKGKAQQQENIRTFPCVISRSTWAAHWGWFYLSGGVTSSPSLLTSLPPDASLAQDLPNFYKEIAVSPHLSPCNFHLLLPFLSSPKLSHWRLPHANLLLVWPLQASNVPPCANP